MPAVKRMTAADPDRVADLCAYAERTGLYSSGDNLAYYGDWIFHGLPLAGRRVLDIGCGRGLIPLYARCRGARLAVGLEPEAAGASDGMLACFRESVCVLGLDRVVALADTVESYAERKAGFDVVTMCQVINHLDEAACSRLHYDAAARAAYVTRLQAVADLVAPGGSLIVTDCGRLNLFRPVLRAGLPHPFAPTIEWHKHQEPELWCRLLGEAGFDEMSCGWRTPNRLRRFAWALGNRFAARCLTSEFRIVARRRG